MLRQARLAVCPPFGDLLYGSRNMFAKNLVVQRVFFLQMISKSMSSFFLLLFMARAPVMVTSSTVGITFRRLAKRDAFFNLDFEAFSRVFLIVTIFFLFLR